MKIRTDFVTNSSSSSFVAVTVNMKTGESYHASWNSGDIDIDYASPIILSKKEYLKLHTGAELMQLCYEHVKETSEAWYRRAGQEIEDFRGNADKIRAIKDFSDTVATVKIESNLSIYEPMYEHVSSFNYYTGKCSGYEAIEDDEDYGEDGDEENDEKIYYYGGITFEDDIYNPKIEKQFIEKCKRIPENEWKNMLTLFNYGSADDDRADIARKIYEKEARFLAQEEVKLQKLHDPDTFLSILDPYLPNDH